MQAIATRVTSVKVCSAKQGSIQVRNNKTKTCFLFFLLGCRSWGKCLLRPSYQRQSAPKISAWIYFPWIESLSWAVIEAASEIVHVFSCFCFCSPTPSLLVFSAHSFLLHIFSLANFDYTSLHFHNMATSELLNTEVGELLEENFFDFVFTLSFFRGNPGHLLPHVCPINFVFYHVLSFD